MLVLSRKQDQEIIIGDNIKIKVLRVKGNTIRLGIEAPREVKVVRGELPPQPSPAPQATESANLANVTVVFSNDTTTRRPNLDVIPFADPGNGMKDTKTHSQRGIENRQGSPETVSYQERLPASLRHNRLKQLVKELTKEQN